MVTLKKLGPEEIAVLDAIIAQRIDSEGNIFEYDYKKTQEYLNKTGASRKHIITPDVQRKIVGDLSEAHIINMDSIVSAEFINNYRLSQNPDYVIDEKMPKYFWFNRTDWAYKNFQFNGRLSIEEAYNLSGGSIYIKMTKDEAQELNNKYVADRKVYLKLNTDNHRLYISIDTDKNWIKLPTIHNKSIAYTILANAWRNAGRKVTLDQLIGAGLIKEKYKDSYMSNLLQKNKTIRALHPKLLYQGNHHILFKKSTVYTYSELYDLITKLNIDLDII